MKTWICYQIIVDAENLNLSELWFHSTGNVSLNFWQGRQKVKVYIDREAGVQLLRDMIHSDFKLKKIRGDIKRLAYGTI